MSEKCSPSKAIDVIASGNNVIIAIAEIALSYYQIPPMHLFSQFPAAIIKYHFTDRNNLHVTL
ncbi:MULTISPECIES: hypothetical protein [Providencia]|uniref:hypothetical protein n=1 Tax=Providencia TaxID=586 RepID=UPI0012B5A937|nr:MULTISPECIES: hypothetical protein [Providencia]MTB38436.1 hypothetical protein [Providencia sp. wls1949]ELR5120275.1 hypothetical protein [Providencia stuartii]ELR5123340.1 hypothetical protein [Providencia stuartii]MBG5918011.1 hypothetical protein [Providencia stuartii]QIC16381.1 hypothetical protein G3341_12120 [Providencia vermicola]